MKKMYFFLNYQDNSLLCDSDIDLNENNENLLHLSQQPRTIYRKCDTDDNSKIIPQPVIVDKSNDIKIIDNVSEIVTNDHLSTAETFSSQSFLTTFSFQNPSLNPISNSNTSSFRFSFANNYNLERLNSSNSFLTSNNLSFSANINPYNEIGRIELIICCNEKRYINSFYLEINHGELSFPEEKINGNENHDECINRIIRNQFNIKSFECKNVEHYYEIKNGILLIFRR